MQGTQGMWVDYGHYTFTAKGTWARPETDPSTFRRYRKMLKRKAALLGCDVTARLTGPNRGVFTIKVRMRSSGNPRTVALAVLDLVAGLNTCVAPKFVVTECSRPTYRYRRDDVLVVG